MIFPSQYIMVDFFFFKIFLWLCFGFYPPLNHPTLQKKKKKKILLRQTLISSNITCDLRKTMQEKHLYIFSSDVWLPLRREQGKELLSPRMEHHVSAELRGIYSSLAIVSRKPMTSGAIKLPIIIHQVLRVLLSTFRASA